MLGAVSALQICSLSVYRSPRFIDADENETRNVAQLPLEIRESWKAAVEERGERAVRRPLSELRKLSRGHDRVRLLTNSKRGDRFQRTVVVSAN